MEAVGLIEPDGSHYIRLSILGHACGQSPLELESAMQLIEMLRLMQPDDLTPMTLMALVQALPEQDADYTPLGKGRSESNRPAEFYARFGSWLRALHHPAAVVSVRSRPIRSNNWGLNSPISAVSLYPQSLSQL
jgi:helicase